MDSPPDSGAPRKSEADPWTKNVGAKLFGSVRTRLPCLSRIVIVMEVPEPRVRTPMLKRARVKSGGASRMPLEPAERASAGRTCSSLKPVRAGRAGVVEDPDNRHRWRRTRRGVQVERADAR